jgi:hypothetical protein
MKILTIPDPLEMDLGPYGPACEGFVDSLKEFFSFAKFRKSNAEKLKGSKDYRFLAKVLESDLHKTYDNANWIKDNLPEEAYKVVVRALNLANVAEIQLSTIQEILKVGRGQLRVVKDIYKSEEPFIELRNKLAQDILESESADYAEEVWLRYRSGLSTTSAQRYYVRHKHRVPALAERVEKGHEWPIPSTHKGERGFYYNLDFRTTGIFPGVTVSNARTYAQGVRDLLALALEFRDIGYQSQLIDSSEFYAMFEDPEEDDDEDTREEKERRKRQLGWMSFEDEVTNRIFYSDEYIVEVSDLAFDVAALIGRIAVGVYLAMFDSVPSRKGY